MSDVSDQMAQPVASRERVAEVLHREGHSEPCHYGNPVNCRVAAGAWDRTDALFAAGVFSEPRPECGAVDRTGQRMCVFTPGHHEVENWTSHGDRGGWTWNDQPARREAKRPDWDQEAYEAAVAKGMPRLPGD